MISLERLDSYMTSGELEDDAVQWAEHCGDDEVAIEVKDGAFGWEDDEDGNGGEENGNKAWLKDVNLEIKKGTLAAVVGTVGSGKSSLLSCLLGEMHKISGKVNAASYFN